MELRLPKTDTLVKIKLERGKGNLFFKHDLKEPVEK